MTYGYGKICPLIFAKVATSQQAEAIAGQGRLSNNPWWLYTGPALEMPYKNGKNIYTYDPT